jgi:hypothetical protein
MWNDLEIPSFSIGGWDTPFGTTPTWDTPPIPFPDIPKFHSGGVFNAPRGQSEGLALLRNNEVVFTPEQYTAMVNEGPAGAGITQNIYGGELSPSLIAELANRRLGRALAVTR